MKNQRPEVVRAFNKGADARIEGKSRQDNPYYRTEHGSERRAWNEGWRSVHRSWGKDAGEHTFTPLPAVQEPVSA